MRVLGEDTQTRRLVHDAAADLMQLPVVQAVQILETVVEAVEVIVAFPGDEVARQSRAFHPGDRYRPPTA